MNGIQLYYQVSWDLGHVAAEAQSSAVKAPLRFWPLTLVCVIARLVISVWPSSASRFIPRQPCGWCRLTASWPVTQHAADSASLLPALPCCRLTLIRALTRRRVWLFSSWIRCMWFCFMSVRSVLLTSVAGCLLSACGLYFTQRPSHAITSLKLMLMSANSPELRLC